MSRGIDEREEFLVVDCGSRDEREISQLYRDFAVACVKTQARRVLLKARHGNLEAHLALRDALTVMLLAGIPREFRIGFVAERRPTADALAAVGEDLRRLGVAAALFDSEEPALAWLGASAGGGSGGQPHQASSS